MWWSEAKALVAALCVLLVSACGFHPIHGGAHGPETRAELASVRIEPIEDRIGQMLRNHLLDSMNPTGMPSRPAYKLVVVLQERKSELGIQRSEFATRANLNLIASYRLLRAADSAPVFQGSSNLTASYNLLNNEFATLVAESDARARAARELSDDITQRVAAYFRQQEEARQKGAAPVRP